jgi:hypothetical protein
LLNLVNFTFYRSTQVLNLNKKTNLFSYITYKRIKLAIHGKKKLNEWKSNWFFLSSLRTPCLFFFFFFLFNLSSKPPPNSTQKITSLYGELLTSYTWARVARITTTVALSSQSCQEIPPFWTANCRSLNDISDQFFIAHPFALS